MNNLESNRVLSLDVFRGLTILTMIFVNDVASVSDIPMWLKHYPAELSGMTFVDLVFPAFLFIVGMSVPYAIQNRIKKGDTNYQIIKHIITRTIGLIIIGIMMVNTGRLNTEATGMTKGLWTFLMLISVIFIWYKPPSNIVNSNRIISRILPSTLKVFGIVTLFIITISYRGGTDDNITWFITSWWGILGLIGWAYLTTCIVYFIFKENLIGILGMIAFFIALYIGDQSGALSILKSVTNVLWIGGHIGGHAAITTSGLAVSLVFMNNEFFNTHTQKIKWTLVFAAFLFVIGFLLEPLYGVNKNLATPAWDLYSAGFCCLIFVFLYYLIDIKGLRKGLFIFRPTGSNPLLAYLIPDVLYALIGIFQIKFIHQYFSNGLLGVGRSIVFTIIVVLITAHLTYKKVVLKL